MSLNCLSEQEILDAILKLENENHDLKTRLHASQEPIAVVGMACQFPDAPNLEAFWQNLLDGNSAISEIPSDRWAVDQTNQLDLDASEMNACRWGGFIRDVYDFNPKFFGILEQEAYAIDPQHRLFMQSVYHALEHAGISLEALAHQNAGVYASIMSDDYGSYTRHPSGAALIDMDDLIGNEKSFISGRISHWLKIKGPSLVFSTACSSSLVAIHYAKSDLQKRACDIAIVGGINLMLTPYWHIAESKLTALSQDGKCRAFSKYANGYVRGEGCGVVVLQRYNDAVKAGANILAVIEGSAVNHTGEAMNLTSPNPQAQTQVIEKALNDASISATDVQYVETHGSGTILGDSIELSALKDAYCKTTQRPPMILGAVKTNIGHLEAASGIAGFIKTVLCLQKKQIPQNLNNSPEESLLNIDDNSVQLPFDTINIEEQSPFIAGVSSFGLSGTNAHVILSNRYEDASTKTKNNTHHTDKQYAITLSANSESELYLQINALIEFINNHHQTRLCDLAYTLSCRRTHFDFRKTFVASSIEGLSCQLKDIKQQERLEKKQAFEDVYFLFPGFGEQSSKIASKLYQNNQTFKTIVDTCSEKVKNYADIDILNWIDAKDTAEKQETIDFAALIGRASDQNTNQEMSLVEQHLLLFVIEYSLFYMLSHLGINPTKCVGYSLGELTAWICAEIVSFEQLLKFVIQRARLIEKTPLGGMIAIHASSKEVEAILHGVSGSISISAELSDSLCVVSGVKNELAILKSALHSKELFFSEIQVDYAIHSSHQGQNQHALADLVVHLDRNEPKRPILSNVTGDWLTADDIQDNQYFAKHLCSTVKLKDCLNKITSDKAAYFEIGPGSSLLNIVQGNLMHKGIENKALFPTLSHRFQEANDEAVFLKAIGMFWEHGGQVDWKTLFTQDAKLVQNLLPYPFDNARYQVKERVNWQVQTRQIHPQLEKRDVAHHLYRPVWIKENMTSDIFPKEKRSILIIDDTNSPSLLMTTCLSCIEYDELNTAHCTSNELNNKLDGYEKAETHLKIPITIVCPLYSTDKLDTIQNYKKAFQIAKTLIQRIDQKYKLLFIINNHYSVVANEGQSGLGHLLEGIVQTLEVETSHIESYLIDLDLSNPPSRMSLVDFITALDNTKLCHDERKIFALRNNFLWHQHIIETNDNKQHNVGKDIFTDKTIIITGGFGAIGREIAKELSKKQNISIILLTRHMDAKKRQVLTALKKLNKQIDYLELDISADNAATHLNESLSKLNQDKPLIIFHCAGLPDNQLLSFKSKINQDVLDAKVNSFDNLLAFCKLRSVKHLVNFSSSVTHFSMPGQCDYISANSYLNTIAESQTDSELDTNISTIAWSFWQYDSWQDDLLATDQKLLAQFKNLRTSWGIDARSACQMIEFVINNHIPLLVVLPEDKHNYKAGLKQTLDLFSTREHDTQPADEVTSTESKSDLLDTIKATWKNIFNCEMDGQSDFFQLGGNSLVAMRMLGTFKKVIPNLKLTIKDIFVCRTIESLHNKIMTNVNDTQQSISIQKHKNTNEMPLSCNQDELWLTHQFHPIKHLFNEGMAYHIYGEFYISAFKQAIESIVARHSIFKTALQQNGFNTKQVYIDEPNICFDIENISHCSQNERLSLIHRFIEQPLDLNTASLFKTKIFKIDDNHHIVIFLFHHIIIDGHSYQLFLKELHENYSHFIAGKTTSKAQQDVYTYFDYAAWQKELVETESYQRNIKKLYALSEKQPSTIKYDHPEHYGKSFKAHSINIDIKQSLYQAIKQMAQSTGTSVFAILYSAFCLYILGLQNKEYVLVGSVSANRDKDEFNEVIGYFVNTIPLFSKYDPDLSVRTTIVNNFYNILGAIEDGVVPFGQMIKDAKVNNLSLTHLFSKILFLVHEVSQQTLSLEDLTVSEINIPDRVARAEIVFEFKHNVNSLSGELIYNCSLYQASTCQYLISGFIKSLELLVKSSSCTQKDFIDKLKSMDVFHFEKSIN